MLEAEGAECNFVCRRIRRGAKSFTREPLERSCRRAGRIYFRANLSGGLVSGLVLVLFRARILARTTRAGGSSGPESARRILIMRAKL